MQHRGTQRIETARLLLRPFRVEDAELLDSESAERL